MSRRQIAIGVVGLAVSASVTLAQTNGTYLITFNGVVTPLHPTMTVGVWATWDDPQKTHLFGAGNYDLQAGDGEFVSGLLKVGLSPPNSIGIISGRSVIGAAIGQVFLPGIPPGYPDNPLLLATYEWTTTDFTPRTILFETSNTDRFFVFDPSTFSSSNLVPNFFFPGSTQYVIPVPSTIALITCGGLTAMCRRRTRSMNNV